jgi:hypothetical protein
MNNLLPLGVRGRAANGPSLCEGQFGIAASFLVEDPNRIQIFLRAVMLRNALSCVPWIQVSVLGGARRPVTIRP